MYSAVYALYANTTYYVVVYSGATSNIEMLELLLSSV